MISLALRAPAIPVGRRLRHGSAPPAAGGRGRAAGLAVAARAGGRRRKDSAVEWHADDFDHADAPPPAAGGRSGSEGGAWDEPVIDATAETRSCDQDQDADSMPAGSWNDVAEMLGDERSVLETERQQTLDELGTAFKRGAQREVETAARFVKRVRHTVLTMLLPKKD